MHLRSRAFDQRDRRFGIVTADFARAGEVGSPSNNGLLIRRSSVRVTQGPPKYLEESST